MTPLLAGCGIIALATGLALMMLALPRALPLPRYGRVAWGIAATPATMGALYLICISLVPSIATAVTAWLPLVLGGALCLGFRRRLRLRCHYRSPVAVLLAIGLLFFLFLMLLRIGYYVKEPIGNSDALQYLAQARYMATPADSQRNSGVAGLADGSLRGDIHGPLWVATLAAPHSESGLTDGTTIRITLSAVFFACLAATVATASAWRMPRLPAIAVLMLVTIPYIDGSFAAGWRDGFRLANLLLLLALLLAHTGNRRAIGRKEWPLAAFAGAAAVQGHGIAAILVPLMVASWASIAFFSHTARLRIVMLSAAAALGFTLGVAHLLHAYVNTGSFIGDNVVVESLVQGTPYENAVSARNNARIGEGETLIGRMRITFKRDGGWPSVPAMISVVAGAIFLMRKRLRRRNARLLTLGVWWCVNTLFLLGTFDIGNMTFGAWTTLNPRYAMQWYLMAALVMACSLAMLVVRLESARKFIWQLSLMVLLSVFVGWQLHYLATRWKMMPQRAYWDMAEKLNALTAKLPESCRILSEDTGVNFYSKRSVIQLYSKYQNDLLSTSDSTVIDALLRERQLCTVVLYTGLYVDKAGKDTPLMRLLESTSFAMLEIASWRVYIRQ